jgi:hypothetical protein
MRLIVTDGTLVDRVIGTLRDKDIANYVEEFLFRGNFAR